MSRGSKCLIKFSLCVKAPHLRRKLFGNLVTEKSSGGLHDGLVSCTATFVRKIDEKSQMRLYARTITSAESLEPSLNTIPSLSK